jgi:predicted nucleic acid-binding protein
LWRSEFRNIIALAIGKKSVAIPERSTCTAYDCEFVALAHSQEVQLVTADRQIRREFPEVAISLREFVQN